MAGYPRILDYIDRRALENGKKYLDNATGEYEHASTLKSHIECAVDAFLCKDTSVE